MCNREMGFVYVLSGWEGSASDSRVLQDAITHRNSLKIPHGNDAIFGVKPIQLA
ncbi:hypothetical protein Ahy_B08g092036 [Arachis hypogaea]|uniref:DDE Tnp4 domain-containing protein n=1 Tax=Arachis hypogaea TaxID=3818 RepID=A0A444Y2Z6_ARAHY|nr:hypothetical protein Ahy_B08g092036 [Arachis hypogaea]